ncbi:Csf1r, partial [Columba guinea]
FLTCGQLRKQKLLLREYWGRCLRGEASAAQEDPSSVFPLHTGDATLPGDMSPALLLLTAAGIWHAREKPVSVMMDPIDHVRIVGETFEVTCRVIAPSHKYDIRWVTAAKSVRRTKKLSFENENYLISDTLSVPSVTMEDTGTYTCIANNSAGFRNASTMLQVVERGFVFLMPVPATSQEVAVGESLKLQVHIEAYPKLLHWGWEHTNPLKNSGSTTFKGQMISGNNWYNNTLFLNRLQEGEGGLYTFYALNNETSASVTFSISVKSPPRVCKIKVPANDSSILQCMAIGYPAPRIEWYQCPIHSDRYNEEYRLLLNDSSPQVMNVLPFQEVEVESTVPFQELGANFTFCCLAINREGNSSDMLHSLTITRSIMAPPNKLFSPILSTCIGTSVLLLLLLLFLLYKYNQPIKAANFAAKFWCWLSEDPADLSPKQAPTASQAELSLASRPEIKRWMDIDSGFSSQGLETYVEMKPVSSSSSSASSDSVQARGRKRRDSSGLYSIMQACWSLEPTQRPTFDQIGCFIQKELEVHKEQDYTNLPSPAEEDSGCDTSGCCEETCEQEESGQPLLKSNNYQFC